MAINIPVKNLSVDQLVDIFYLFCKAYNIESDERDESFFRNLEIEAVNSGSTIDYRPFMGAKFFVVGHDKYTEFWGYTSDGPQLREEEKFNKLVIDYLSEKSEH